MVFRCSVEFCGSTLKEKVKFVVLEISLWGIFYFRHPFKNQIAEYFEYVGYYSIFIINFEEQFPIYSNDNFAVCCINYEMVPKENQMTDFQDTLEVY